MKPQNSSKTDMPLTRACNYEANTSSKYDHITPILQNIQWFSVDQCIQFKVLLATYKAVSVEPLEYLCDLVILRRPSRA